MSIVFITLSYFKVPTEVRLSPSYFFITKIPNKRECQKIPLNHSSDINFKDFIKIYRKCTAEPYSFMVNDTTSLSDNPLIERLQKYLPYHQAKLISMNILLLKKYYLLIKNK